MSDYRIYHINELGSIFQPPHLAQCIDDETAIAEAHACAKGMAVEVWNGTRLVLRIGREVWEAECELPPAPLLATSPPRAFGKDDRASSSAGSHR
jgi:hypothetical protein